MDLGARQNGVVLDDVVLPPWANGSCDDFVRIHRQALESEHVSRVNNLPPASLAQVPPYPQYLLSHGVDFWVLWASWYRMASTFCELWFRLIVPHTAISAW